jgi:HlyD family secretion protein
LLVSKSISAFDLEKSESQLLQKKYAFESAKNTITATEITISGLEQSIIESEKQHSEQKSGFEISLRETYENLVAQIELWEQTYLLKSPTDGQITFDKYWSDNQNVTTGETVFTVVPPKTSELIGRAEIPSVGAGKVKKGQRVNVNFDDFPNTEFGTVKGKICDISPVRSGDKYTVRIEFPDSLTTNYHKKIPFVQNMQGNAEIITEDLPLIARLINPLKKLFFENI